MQRVAHIQKLLLAVEPEIAEGCFTRLTPQAVEFPAVDANDLTQVAFPAKDGTEDSVELLELQVVGHGDQPDYHWAYLTENRAQDQAFDGRASDVLDILPHYSRFDSVAGFLTLSLIQNSAVVSKILAQPQCQQCRVSRDAAPGRHNLLDGD